MECVRYEAMRMALSMVWGLTGPALVNARQMALLPVPFELDVPIAQHQVDEAKVRLCGWRMRVCQVDIFYRLLLIQS